MSDGMMKGSSCPTFRLSLLCGGRLSSSRIKLFVMKHYSRSLAAVVLGVFTLAGAQGGASIISLAMPPPGGDGHSALQSGTAMATGVASAWHNPALLANLGKATGSHIHFASVEQELNLGESQQFSGVALVYPGLGNDLGIAVYRNKIDLGGSFTNGESVYGLAAGVGFVHIMSLGLAAKYYQSEIGVAEAKGWAFDVGLAASRRYRPAGELPAFDVMPSVGIALRNLGSEVSYGDPELSDPLPRTWSNGAGLEINFADAVQVTFAGDFEKEVHRRARWSDPWQKSYAYTASLLGFRYGEAWLRDPAGERFEKHVMREFEFNFQRLMKVRERVASGDFKSATAETAARIPGTNVRANPRFVIGKREITSGGVRSGENATYFSLSL
jgi:hypothetical protein